MVAGHAWAWPQNPAYRPTPHPSVVGFRAVDAGDLRGIPLFAELPDESLDRIAGICTEFDAPAGHVLVEVGHAGSGMFIIREGSVAVELPGGGSVELGPGDFFGEAALLTDAPRMARVRARSSVRCLAIGRRDFANLLREEPAIAVQMLPVVARRMSEAP